MAIEHSDTDGLLGPKRDLEKFQDHQAGFKRTKTQTHHDSGSSARPTTNWKKAKSETAKRLDLAIATDALPDRYQKFYQIIADQITLYRAFSSKQKVEKRKALKLAELAFRLSYAHFENLMAQESCEASPSVARITDCVHYLGSLCILRARISPSPSHRSSALQAQELFSRNAKVGDKRAFAMFSHLALYMGDPLTALVCALRMLKFGESKRGHADAERAMRAIASSPGSLPAAVPAILSSMDKLEISPPTSTFRAPLPEPPLMVFKLIILATLMEYIYKSHSPAANKAVLPLAREFAGPATKSRALLEADSIWKAVYRGIENDVNDFVTSLIGNSGLMVAKWV